jgi:L,D-transpeptidase catalytic domain
MDNGVHEARDLELLSASPRRQAVGHGDLSLAASPVETPSFTSLIGMARSEGTSRFHASGLLTLQRLVGNAAVHELVGATTLRSNHIVQRQYDEEAGDGDAGGRGGAECSCVAEDEAADVHEVTPDASLAVAEGGSGESPAGAAGGLIETSVSQSEDLEEVQSFSGIAVQRDPEERDQPAQQANPKKKKKKAPTPYDLGCRQDAKACFSISKRKAWLLDNGKVVAVVPALGGKSGHSTPVGKFSVDHKDAKHSSSLYKDKSGRPAPMPNFVRFAPAVGFHAGSLSQESHGCVHLSPSDAKKFFDALNTGDKVDVVK